MSQRQLFFRQFIQDFFHVGAILPSSRALARAVVAYLARKQGPVRVLEAGAGTGAFTREIVPLLQPGDTLDIVEINPRLMESLQQRFRQETQFQKQDVEINFIIDDVRHISSSHFYNFIVFSLPLTNFPSAMVQEILALMMNQLQPGGVFSYVHYIFISRFKYLFGGATVRAQMRANQEIIDTFAAKYQIKRRAVWWNVPPSWTYYWQKPGVD
ncbi:MAG: methyltransferase domain-containing protein [Anaerolineae bacterium]|nr:methyltransferase domain-containing protein [Anaerolineae bacterium]